MKQKIKKILPRPMYKTLLIIMLSFCVMLIAQRKSSTKKWKVYRTQTGAIIKAPKPFFEKGEEKPKTTYYKETQVQIQLQRLELKFKNQLEHLGLQIEFLNEQSRKRQTDTIFVYTTLYDTTTVFDSTFIYTNATTTVYDTVIVIDSLYINRYDTTTIVQTNYDTMVVLDTAFFYTYDTTVVRDTLWAFAFDTVLIYDTSWVFAYDTTVIRDSLWLFAFDSTVVYDTLVIFNNDTVTIHTHSSSFTPDMTDRQRSQFPKWESLDDAIRARDTGDPTAQEWINQALYEAGGDWDKANDEYIKFQKIYSSAVVKSILNRPNNSRFIGPEMKYRSVVFDTLKILTFDTTLIQDTIRNLLRQTYVKYDTMVVNKSKDVIAHVTPPGHELILKYYSNGNVKERGLIKDSKRNGLWVFYDNKGKEIRRTTYAKGKIRKDTDLNDVTQNPMKQTTIKKEKRRKNSKSKKSKKLLIFPKRDKK